MTPRLPVLTFHAVDAMRSPVAIDPTTFRGMMTRLAAAGWKTVRASEAVEFAEGKYLPARRFLITFDDGYASVLREAAPVLIECAFTAILFLTPGLVGRAPIFPGDRLCPPEPALTWAEARVLVEAGFEIGSHAALHRRLTGLSDADLRGELVGSRDQLEQKLGVAVRLHAYPFGAWDERVAEACAGAYDGGFTTRLDWVRMGDDPSLLPRLDAHYLRGLAARGSLDGAGTKAWIALRRAGRSVREALGRGSAGS